jgi:hypothetical protein|tara:strand:- start:1900 stop:2319 length:420 start_codon:yes stop_codon:yes gene_type:complete
MANYDKAVERLQKLLTEQDLVNIPHQVEDKIIIGPIVVKPTRSGAYIVLDRIHNTSKIFNTKLGAVAYAKNIKQSHIFLDKIYYLDKVLSKHDNDCAFYKNTIKKTASDTKREVAQNRYCISKHYVVDCKDKIYKMIFN